MEIITVCKLNKNIFSMKLIAQFFIRRELHVINYLLTRDTELHFLALLTDTLQPAVTASSRGFP